MTSARNYQGIACLSAAVPGEPVLNRVFRCSATYTASDAAGCAYPNPQMLSVLTDNWASFKSSARTATGVSSTSTVQWQMSMDNGANFVPVPGGIFPTYSFSALAWMTGSQYRAVWSNRLGSVYTGPATLTVNSVAAPRSVSFGCARNCWVEGCPCLGLGAVSQEQARAGPWRPGRIRLPYQ